VITMITVGVIGFLASSTSIFSPSNILAFVLGGLALLVLVLVMLVAMVFLALVLSRTDQRIELTEQGMTIRQGGRTHSVAWDEARLFAIEGVYGVNHALSPSVYQLASAKDMLKWIYQRRRTAPHRSRPYGLTSTFPKNLPKRAGIEPPTGIKFPLRKGWRAQGSCLLTKSFLRVILCHRVRHYDMSM